MSELDTLVKSLNKRFGKNALRLGKDVAKQASFRIPTGSIALDVATGGGIPSGRLTTIAGVYSSSKSLLSYKIIANAQKMFKEVVDDREVISNKGTPFTCALIQLENNSFTTEWAEKQGVDTESLVFVAPNGMEEALDIATALQKAGVELIVIDSYTALSPTKVIESSFSDSVQMGLRAKALGDFHNRFQALNNGLEREGKIPTTVIAINQLREKISLYSSEFIPGGRSIGYTSSLEIRLRIGDALTEGTGDSKRVVGKEIKFKIEKSKVGTPYQTGSYLLYTDDCDGHTAGEIDNEFSLMQLAIDCGVIERRGAWYFYNGDQLAQGKDALMLLLKDNVELFDIIKNQVMEICKE